MRKLLSFLFILASASAADLVGTTPQQIVVRFSDPNPTSCTITVYESDGTTKANDTNNSVFANSEKCSNHGPFKDGDYVVGKRTAEMGDTGSYNGVPVSRSLECDAQYTVHIVKSDSTTIDIPAKTRTLQWGDTHPEMPGFLSGAPDNYGYPLMDWSDAGAAKKYIDPLNGVSFKRGPRGMRSGVSHESKFAGVFGGTNWTNASNAVNNSASGPFATYANTGQDPIYLVMSPDFAAYRTGGDQSMATPYYSSHLIEDLQAILYGDAVDTGTLNDRKVSVSMSTLYNPSGSPTFSTEFDLTLPTSTSGDPVNGPSSFPLWQFNGWTAGHTLNQDETTVPSNALGGGATVSSSAVTFTDKSFLPRWAATGMKININGTWYTLGTLDRAQHFSLQEASVNIATSSDWYMGAWVIRIRKKTAVNNQIRIGAGWKAAYSSGVSYGANGIPDFCSRNTLSIDYAADGATPITPKPGRICIAGATSSERFAFLLADDGETRYLSNLSHFDYAYSGGAPTVPLGSFHPTDAKKLLGAHTDDSGSTKVALYEIAYDDSTCHYRAWAGDSYGTNGSPPSDCMTWTNITPASSGQSISDLMSAHLATDPYWVVGGGVFPTYTGTLGTRYAVFVSNQEQNSPCWNLTFDVVSKTEVSYFSSLDISGSRWNDCHSPGLVYSDGGTWGGYGNEIMGGKSNPHDWLGGTYVLKGVTAKSLDGGTTWNTDTSLDPGHYDSNPPHAAWNNTNCGSPAWYINGNCLNLSYGNGVAGPCGTNSYGVTGNQCVKLKIADDRPCSIQQSSTDPDVIHWPCPWSATLPQFTIVGTGGGTVNSGSPSQASTPLILQAGDFISHALTSYNGDNNYVDGKAEKMRILSKTSNGGNGAGGWIIDVQRWAACDNPTSDPALGAVTYWDHAFQGSTGATFENGWTALMTPTATCGGNTVLWDMSHAIDGSHPMYVDASAISSSHATVGKAPDGNTLQVGPGVSRHGTLPSMVSSYDLTNFAIDSTSWGSKRNLNLTNLEQYPALGNWSVTQAFQRGLYYDFRHINPNSGSNTEDLIVQWSHTYTKVTTGGRNFVWKVNVNGVTSAYTTEQKENWPVVFSSRGVFRNISGPSSVLDDSTMDSFCVVYTPGECVPGYGTSYGDVYFTTKNANLEQNGCISDTYRTFSPCVSYMMGPAGWAIQGDAMRADPTGTRIRRLSMGLVGPSAQYQYSSPHMTPTGLFAMIAAGWANLVKYNLLITRVPSPPADDAIDRSDYIPVNVSVPAGPTYVRAEFGYVENGGNFYCTPRQENCVTDNTLSPFAFESSDSLTAKSCASGCTLSIPAISGRTLYYRIQRSPDGSTWTSMPMAVKTIR
jgi:hypothetical protein